MSDKTTDTKKINLDQVELSMSYKMNQKSILDFISLISNFCQDKDLLESVNICNKIVEDIDLKILDLNLNK